MTKTLRTAAFKKKVALEALREDKTIAQIASDRHVHPNLLYQWKATAVKGLSSLFRQDLKGEAALKASYDKRLEDLYAEIGRLTTQVSWLKKKSGLESHAD